jgi:hypothetical protein
VLAAPSRLLAASWLLWPVVSAGLYSLGDRRETVLTYGLAAVMAAQLLAYLWIVFRGRGSALWGFGFSGEVLTPYAWPDARHLDGVRTASLDLVHAPCNTDDDIDWSPHDVLVFVSIPAW